MVYSEYRWDTETKKRSSDLWVVEVDSKATERITFDPASDGHPMWSPDGRWIYFVSARSGAKVPPRHGKAQVWRVRPDGTGLQAVTRLADGIAQAELSHDGTTLFYTTSKKHTGGEWAKLKETYGEFTYGHGVVERSHLWSLDLTTWKSRKITGGERVIREFAVSPNGKRVAMLTTPSNELITNEGWSEVDVVDVASGTSQRLDSTLWRAQAPSPYGWLGGPAWSGDSRALAFTVDYDGYPGEVLVARFGAAGPALQKLARPAEVTVKGPLVWTEEDLLFNGERNARVRVHRVEDAAGDTPDPAYVVTSGDVVTGAFSLSRRGDRMAVRIAGPQLLGDVFVVKPAKGQTAFRRVTSVNAHTADWRWPSVEVVQWKGKDGRSVEGILELPPGYDRSKDGPLPTIVHLHGGPASSTKLQRQFWNYGRTLFASQGYALFSPNYRGSTGYGDRFLVDLIGRKNDVDVADILAGVDAVVARGVADPKRLGVMGWSNGGYLTNCLITTTDRFKAASSGAGVVDVIMQWSIEDTPGHVVNYQQGFPWNRFEGMRKASPLFAVDKVKTPTVIHVGSDDPRVPQQHSRALHRALHHYLKVPVELVVYPGMGHGLSSWKQREAKMAWDIAWFERWVRGDGKKAAPTTERGKP